MLTFRDMAPEDRDLVLPMVEDFYHSPAALHPIGPAILEEDFRAAADPAQPLLRGVLPLLDGQPAGYLYITQCWSTEAGSPCVVLEEIYLKPELRGRGLGREILTWLREEYPGARRFRLEVNPENPGAARLYRKSGYDYLRYDQMILDR